MLDRFRNVWLVDSEFQAVPGERPVVSCVVFREYRTGEVRRVWCGGDGRTVAVPVHFGPVDLAVSYYWPAESHAFRALGWPQPANVLDLFTEFRNLRNGRNHIDGYGLLDALRWFNLPAETSLHKESMRQLAIRGGPFSDTEREALLAYCQTDVDALAALLSEMLPHLHPVFSLMRGRYMADVASIEDRGIPIDVEVYENLRANIEVIQDKLITSLKSQYDLYDGRTFKMHKWEAFLKQNGICWPRLESGACDMRDDTFKLMAIAFPDLIKPVRDLRNSLDKLRTFSLPIGRDGRSRCMLSPFRSVTGRNQPKSRSYIFAYPAWMRGLIKPPKGKAIAYIDYSQQEFGIAAALSGDETMQQAYISGDPYLTFAKQACAVPSDATKISHPTERGQYKVCALGVQYGQGVKSLASSLGADPITATQLLKRHRTTYPKYWCWTESAVHLALDQGYLETVFGWRAHYQAPANERSIANFPCQANGAEILRVACRKINDHGIQSCATVHDAVLIEADAQEIEGAANTVQQLMEQAGKEVLNGFPLRTDVEIVKYPNRYMDERGINFWQRVMGILGRPSD